MVTSLNFIFKQLQLYHIQPNNVKLMNAYIAQYRNEVKFGYEGPMAHLRVYKRNKKPSIFCPSR